MKQTNLSRRSFLKIIGITSFSLIGGISLTGCTRNSFTVSELEEYNLSIYGAETKRATFTYIESSIIGTYCGKFLDFKQKAMCFEPATNHYANKEEANEALKQNLGITESYDNVATMLIEEYGIKKTYSTEEIKSFIDKQNELLQTKEEDKNYIKSAGIN